jgi:hypothetical protein
VTHLAMGDSAGVAAAMATRPGLDPPDLDVGSLHWFPRSSGTIIGTNGAVPV